MKAIKNKKRFNPRWHHSERTEDSKEQQTLNEGNIKVNFNSFNMDTWLEEDKGKLFPGGTIADLPKEVPREPRSKGRMTPEEKAKADQKLKNKEPGSLVYAHELEEQEEVAEGGCGGPEMGPEEPQAVPADLSPDEAFGAGYSAAVEEIMASIQGLLEDPMDMTPPEEMAMDDEEMVVQLPDHAMEMQEAAKPTVYMIDIRSDVDRRKYPKDTVGWSKISSSDVEKIEGWYDNFIKMGYTDDQIQFAERSASGKWVEVEKSDVIEDPTGNIDQALMLQQTL